MARTTLGFWLIVIGGLIFLDRMTSVDAWALIIDWWPLVFVYLGIVNLAQRSNFTGWVYLAGGILLQAYRLDYVSGSLLSLLWPLALIIVGLWLVLNRRKGGAARPYDNSSSRDSLNILTIFGGLKEVVNSQAFRGGQATVVFGDVDIDLRKVDFAVERPEIEATVIFGDMEIIVPRNCQVDFKPLTILGDSKQDLLVDHGEGSDPTVTVYVHGLVLFGALKVRN